MARAGRDPRARRCDLLESKIRPGVSTAELDAAAERFIRSQGAVPTFKGYRGFPGSICASPNSMIVHGIPGPYRLKRGDIISIDVGVTLDGWVADAARTFAVGEVDAAARRTCSSATEESLHAGVAQCRGGQPHGRRLARDPAGRRGRGPVGRALARRARRRAQHARGPAGAQLRQARQGPAARGGHGARDRADDHRRAARRCAWAATAGRSSPRTARWPRTSSSRSRSPPPGRASSRPGTCRGRAARGRPAAQAPRRPASGRAPQPDRGRGRSCYHPESCSSATPFVRARAYPRPGSGGRNGSQSRVAGTSAERDHEGKTVGQADVREVQDHPPPRSGAGDLPEQAPQAAAGLIG